jgi:aryl-alcohol dehydrogenase
MRNYDWSRVCPQLSKPEAGVSDSRFWDRMCRSVRDHGSAYRWLRSLIAVDRIPSRLELAAKLGATHCIDSEKTDIAKFIKSVCGGVDYAFDTSGNSYLLDAMRKVLNAGAFACGVGIGGTLALSERERREGKSWVTTNTGFSVPSLFIPKLLEYYKAGQFPLETMLHFYRFGEINEAFETNRECTGVKPVVLME